MTAIPVSMQAPNDFKFEEPEGRPFRTISIETEMDGSGTKLAKKLYATGFIGTDYVMDYGRHPGNEFPHVAFLKYDGSVSAGELVFDRLNLTNPVHSKLLNSCMGEIRGLEKGGHVIFAPNCGGHIHIDAKGFGVYDAIRLSQGYGFIEEIIGRLAGSGKTYGHRSLYRGFDRANAGRGYCNPITKLGNDSPATAWGKISSQARMSGLNFVPFVGAQCSRGHSIPLQLGQDDDLQAKLNAPWTDEELRIINDYVRSEQVYYNRYEPGRWNEDMEAEFRAAAEADQRHQREYRLTRGRRVVADKKPCTCDLKQNTIEWRIWNSQSNPRILYAWIAVMQALHAWAWRPAHVERYRVIEPMPEFTWTGVFYDKLSEEQVRLSQDRVAWMFAELPLTAEEKDALAYSFMRTPYKAWGRPFFTERAKEPYKRPQYLNSYSRKERTIADRPMTTKPIPRAQGAPRGHADRGGARPF